VAGRRPAVRCAAPRWSLPIAPAMLRVLSDGGRLWGGVGESGWLLVSGGPFFQAGPHGAEL
jgi:hypothetical protein